MSVDVVTASWLRSASAMTAHTDAPVRAAWGDIAIVSEIISPLALEADAVAEAARQHSFFAVPLAVETIDVPGKREDAVGRLLEIEAAGGGYSEGVKVYVIKADPVSGADRTLLTVLRRLA